ncbi:MAG: 16S rRNA (adenine(1518)-N(6)/adenine(1519)-N(6))-dimethyltransferase RsmA [Pseudomonadota bacterium]
MTEDAPAARKPENPRAVLARHGLEAKKSWGQNFLVDRNAHDRIARAVGAAANDVVVEIGAGLGTLTLTLLAQAVPPRRVVAVERDPDMLAVLRAELGRFPSVEIRGEDAVHFDFAAAARAAGGPVVVVGNLPYQITSALLFAIVDAGAAVSRATVMVQREFAERVVAPPGSKTYGRLSVMVQQRMETKILFNVTPGSFFPRPRVMSAVLAVARRPSPLAPVADDVLFARVVKEAFATRRKMLRRSLADAFGEAVAAAAFATSGVSGTRRPEELSVADFARLTTGVAAGLAEG